MLSTSKKILRIKIGEKKVVIIFDDGDKLEISPNVYVEFHLYPNKQLTKKDIKDISNRNEIEKYYSYITKLLLARSYSKHQVKTKLAKKGANEAQIETIISLLIKDQLLDEKALIKEILDYSDYRHFGYNKIKEEMFKKGISSFYVDKIVYDEEREIKHAVVLLKEYERKYSKYNYALMKRHIYEALLRQGYVANVSLMMLDKVSPIDERKEIELLKVDYKKAKDKYSKKYQGYELKEKINQSLLNKGYRFKDINNIKE